MHKTDLLVIETNEREFLFTLGYLHGSDFFNCYPQYVHFQDGDDKRFKRTINNRDYLKSTNILNYYSPENYFRRIKQSQSHRFLSVDPVLGTVFKIPETAVRRIINPREMLGLILSDSEDQQNKETLGLVSELSELFDVNIDDLGLVGTLAYGGVEPSSDFDIVVYGKENSTKASNKIRELRTQKKHQLIKYNRIHHRFFSLDGRMIDPHFVLNPEEESLLQLHTLEYQGKIRLNDVVTDNSSSCFTPAIYGTGTGYFVTYAIGHRMLLDIGTELDLEVEVYEASNKPTNKPKLFYLWQMEDGWVDPTRERKFSYRIYDIPKLQPKIA